MANDDIIQVISDAREDAVSLSQFMYYPAAVTVNRRLAPPIHTLNYYLLYLEGLERVYSQPTGTVEVNGEVVKTVRQSINDAIDSAILGDYQTTLEAELAQEVIRATNREDAIEADLEAEVVRAIDAEEVISQDLSELSLEVNSQKLDTGISVTPQISGSIAIPLSQKNRETVSISQFYNRTDGDYTEAFQAVSNLGFNIIIPPKLDGTSYKVVGSVELTNGTRLIGFGQPEIDLYLTDTYDRGFWIKSSGSIIDGITINKYQTATNGDGRWLNAIVVNDFGDGNNPVKNWRLSNIIINDVGVEKHNTIGIYGNSSNGLIENVTVNGNGTYSLMMHWGYTTPFTKTYHPRDIVVRDFTVNGDIDVTYGIYMSATHNITVENTKLKKVSQGIVVAAGEYGGLYAADESKDKVLSGMVIDGLRVDGIKNDFLYLSARGNSRLREERLKERWHGLDENIDLTIRDVVVLRDSETYSGRLNIEHFKNLTIDGLKVYNLDGADLVTTLPRILIEEGVNIEINACDISAAKGVDVISGKNIKINGNFKCSHPTPNSVSTGITVNGSTQIVGVAANIPAGGTTVQINNVNQNIYKGLQFVQNGNIFEFDSSWHVDTVTPANNYNKVLKIVPSANAIAAGNITLLTGVHGYTQKGNLTGFYNNYVQTSPSKQIPSKCVLADVTFDTSYNFHISINGGDDLVVKGGEFKNGNTLGATGISNIRLNSINYFKAKGVVFDKDSARVNFGVHILTANVATYIFEDCHWGYLLPTGTRGCVYSNYSNIYVHNNTFSDSVRTVGVMPTTVISISTIGTKRVSEGSAPPVNGIWNIGDVVYSRSPTAGGSVGWICTASGASGTWKTFGTISS